MKFGQLISKMDFEKKILKSEQDIKLFPIFGYPNSQQGQELEHQIEKKMKTKF